MKHRLFAAVTVALAAAFLSSAATAQSACGSYRVKKGDSLHTITERVRGLNNYWDLYKANRRAIGRNPNTLRIGMRLRIPCVGGVRKAKPSAPAEPVVTEISFLTANGYAPYTGEALRGGGIFTRLVAQAMTRAAPEVPFEIVFVNDRAAHLDVLLPRGAFDAGFPWPSPDCGGEGAAGSICETYLFSDPFYEIVDGFFSMAGDGYENVIDPAGFEDAKVCRPEGHSTGGLDQWSGGMPFATVVEAATPEACFERLAAGAVDLVALETRTAEHAIRARGLQGRVVENRHLFQLHPLRVAVPKANPRSADIIATLNRGLNILLETEEWSAIVSDGLDTPEPKLTN